MKKQEQKPNLPKQYDKPQFVNESSKRAKINLGEKPKKQNDCETVNPLLTENESLKSDIIDEVKEMIEKKYDKKFENLQREMENLKEETENKIDYLKREHENEIEYLKKEVIELKQKLLAKTNEPSQDLIQHIIDAEEDIDSLIIDGVKITPYRGTNDILDLEDVIDTDTVSKNHQKSSILTFFHLAISQDFLLNFALFFLLSDYYCG